MIERDEFVFGQAKMRKIPIIYLFAGGYALQGADVIGKSLTNILYKYLGIKKGIKIDRVLRLFEK